MGELAFIAIGAMAFFGKIPAEGSLMLGVMVSLERFEIGIKVLNWV